MTTAVEALQTTLAAEHAAVHVYAVLGGRTGESSAPELRSNLNDAYAAHRGRRDQLWMLIRDAGEEPVAAEPAYELPAGADTTDGVSAAALALERSCAETYAWLIAHVVTSTRRWAVGALKNTAVRELAFRGSPEIFPGVDEFADR